MQQQSINRYPEATGIHYAGRLDKVQSAKTNFDALPSPFLNDLIPNQSFIRWETQRGCPFSCSFCQHRESSSLKRRHFDFTRIAHEAKWLCRPDSKVHDLNLVDPTFNSGPNYLNVLNELIKYQYHGKIALQTRLEMIKPEFIDAVVKLNQTAMVVLEFGLQTIHRNEQTFIDRPSNMTKIDKMLNEIHEKSIECEVSLIFGLPGQTVDSFQKSIDYCHQRHVQVVHAFPLMLLRGTPLYEQREKLNLTESDEGVCDEIDRIQEYGIKHVVSSPTFTYHAWRKMAELAGNLEVQNNSYLKKRDQKYVKHQQNINKPNHINKTRDIIHL
jgi:radical SAM superfamily enzyme